MACSPWLAVLLVLILAAWALVRFSRAQLRLGRLFELHRDEVGSVQSLSFVLTLPLFIMIMMMIVQVSQLMIGTVVVHYAAYAAARSGGGVDSGRDAAARRALLHQFLYRRSRRAGPGRAGARSAGRGLRAQQQRRADLHHSAGQPQIHQDRLGGDPGLRADLALARLRVGRPGGNADGCGLEGGVWRVVAHFGIERRDRAKGGSQAGLRHAEHRCADSLLSQESGAAAGDILLCPTIRTSSISTRSAGRTRSR